MNSCEVERVNCGLTCCDVHVARDGMMGGWSLGNVVMYVCDMFRKNPPELQEFYYYYYYY